MKLDVPFYKQTSKTNCGPTALRMVLSYFGDNRLLEEIEKECEIKDGKGVYSIQLSTAASRLGYKTSFYSRHLGVNPENLKMDFYKKYSETFSDQDKIISDANCAGVNISESSISLEELLSFVTKKSVPIILLDWNIVRNESEKGYQGHFVPIVGYDEESIYVHNHGLTNPVGFQSISREVFEKSRTAKGTDEDVVVIFNEPKTL